MESVEAEIKAYPLKEYKRGPGGHWFRYIAKSPNHPDKSGYGDTEREAILDLNSQL